VEGDDPIEHQLNGLDGRINDRGFFERILKEFKETLAERNERLDERFQSQEKAIKKAEDRLDGTLSGFPQEYARKTELEQMRIDLASTATALAEKVTDSASALATSQDKVTERQDARLSSLEKFQNKLLGLALASPFVTGLIFWLIAGRK
jgi:exonuclease VII large subunit